MKDLFIKSSVNMTYLLIEVLTRKKCVNETPCVAALNALSLVYEHNISFLIISSVANVIMCEKTFHTVRIAALKMFDKMARSGDIFGKVEPIVRAVEDLETIGNAMNLLYSLLLGQGREFLINADPLLDFLYIRTRDVPNRIAHPCP